MPASNGLSFSFLVTPVAAFFLARNYVFDVLFFWMLGYTVTGWIPIYPAEKQAFYARYRAWANEVTRAGTETAPSSSAASIAGPEGLR